MKTSQISLTCNYNRSTCQQLQYRTNFLPVPEAVSFPKVLMKLGLRRITFQSNFLRNYFLPIIELPISAFMFRTGSISMSIQSPKTAPSSTSYFNCLSNLSRVQPFNIYKPVQRQQLFYLSYWAKRINSKFNLIMSCKYNYFITCISSLYGVQMLHTL